MAGGVGHCARISRETLRCRTVRDCRVALPLELHCLVGNDLSCISAVLAPLLPVGKTLVCRELIQQGHRCLGRWSTVTVPGTGMRCFLGNVCLVYLVAGLWKLESPMWRQGFALYTVLRLPIAYQPDLWGPQHLLWLQVGTYVALVIEPLIPWLLTRRRGHPLKWLGLLAQLGFHLGIVATLRVPFANLGLASAVLLFRAESWTGYNALLDVPLCCTGATF